jgi:hypothetical protein
VSGQCVPQQTFSTQSPMNYIDTSAASSVQPVSNTIGTMQSTTTASGPSAIDLITSIASPSTTAQTAATGTSIALIRGISDQGGLHAAPQNAAASSTYHGAPSANQTFVSSDLSTEPPRGITARSPLWMLLENIRTTLVSIIAKLQPFGGAKSRPASSEELE